MAIDYPFRTPLTAGKTIFWCTCGLSQKQPYCDGSHRGTSFQPMPYKAEQDMTVALCGCKQTKQPPFCDGAHIDFRKSLAEGHDKPKSE